MSNNRSARRQSPNNRPAFTIIEDTKEQTPLDFSPYAVYGVTCIRRNVRTGDYTVDGFDRQLVIERKSLTDCVGTLMQGRERFTREIYDRAAFASAKLLVVEASLAELSRPYAFAPGANPESVINSLFALQMPPTNLHVFCSPSRALIAWYIFKFCAMFVHRVTHGSKGMWRAIFAPDSADLAPFGDVPKTVRAPMGGPRVDELVEVVR